MKACELVYIDLVTGVTVAFSLLLEECSTISGCHTWHIIAHWFRVKGQRHLLVIKKIIASCIVKSVTQTPGQTTGGDGR